MDRINIYVVTHKNFDDSICKEYIPIAVGPQLLKDELCTYQKDNSGENISSKNANYCELTAQYWMWKNDQNATIKGLSHYRRYFTSAFISSHKKNILNKEQIQKILMSPKYDAIVSQKMYSYRGVKKAYLDCGYEKDLETVKEVLKEKYPEYVSYYDKIFDGCWGYLANMMITSAELFDQYSEWLFDVLFEVEKRADISNYTAQEARIYGYISERLLAVWLLKNKVKVKEMRILNTEEKYGFKYYVIELLRRLKLYQLAKKVFFYLKGRK